MPITIIQKLSVASERKRERANRFRRNFVLIVGQRADLCELRRLFLQAQHLDQRHDEILPEHRFSTFLDETLFAREGFRHCGVELVPGEWCVVDDPEDTELLNHWCRLLQTDLCEERDYGDREQRDQKPFHAITPRVCFKDYN